MKKRLFLPDTKNGKSRLIILNEKALAIIKDLKEERKSRGKDSEYLFPSRDGSKRPNILDLRKKFRAVCEAADIEGESMI